MKHGFIAIAIVSVWQYAVPAQAPLEFYAASIKRSLAGPPTSGIKSGLPVGQFVLHGTPARFIVARAFPDLTTPITIEGLPGWAESERYDVQVKFPIGTTAQQAAEMWLRLLTDRMKLVAHSETRPRTGYKLTIARSDGRLGPQMTRATLDCPPPGTPAPPSTTVRDIAMTVNVERRAPTAQEEAVLMSTCGAVGIGGRWYAGSTDLRGLLQAIAVVGRPDGPVSDATGLDGRYSFKLWAAPANTVPLAAAPNAEPTFADAPDIFSALKDQLGLKLEKTTIDGKVLVVDHLERPTDN